MSVEIKMPKLGQTTDEVHLVRWHVKEGDTVAKGQPLCEAENDKTTMDVESYASGTVLRLTVEPDSVITAGTVIAVLGEPGEKLAAAGPLRAAEAAEAARAAQAPSPFSATGASAAEAASAAQVPARPARAPSALEKAAANSPASRSACSLGALPSVLTTTNGAPATSA